MKPPSRTAIPRKNAYDPSEEADALAAAILGYLAEDPERLRRFFDLTGLTPQSLRAAAAAPGFAASLVDYLAADDRLLLAFAADRGLDPARIDAVRQSLAPRPDESG